MDSHRAHVNERDITRSRSRHGGGVQDACKPPERGFSAADVTALGHGPELGALAASWKTPVAVNAVVPVIQLFAMNSRCSLRCAVLHTSNQRAHDLR